MTSNAHMPDNDNDMPETSRWKQGETTLQDKGSRQIMREKKWEGGRKGEKRGKGGRSFWPE